MFYWYEKKGALYGYTGREIETDELYYYRARYYDADTQRFISLDPIGFASGDFNFYRYVGNSPLNFRDPLGLKTFPYPWEVTLADCGLIKHFYTGDGKDIDISDWYDLGKDYPTTTAGKDLKKRLQIKTHRELKKLKGFQGKKVLTIEETHAYSLSADDYLYAAGRGIYHTAVATCEVIGTKELIKANCKIDYTYKDEYADPIDIKEDKVKDGKSVKKTDGDVGGKAFWFTIKAKGKYSSKIFLEHQLSDKDRVNPNQKNPFKINK